MNKFVRNKSLITPARLLLALATAGIMGLPAMAASSGSQATQNLVVQNHQPQGAQRGSTQASQSMKVSYYTGDPMANGTLISTVTLTRPARQQPPQAGHPGQPTTPQGAPQNQRNQRLPGGTAAQGQANAPRQNPLLANAPAGAKFAVIQDGQGQSRTVDLSKLNDGMTGRDGATMAHPQGPQDQRGQDVQAAPPVR